MRLTRVVLLVLLATAPSSSFAQKLERPAPGVEVIATDEGKQEIARGVTNEDGTVVFDLPVGGYYRFDWGVDIDAVAFTTTFNPLVFHVIHRPASGCPYHLIGTSSVDTCAYVERLSTTTPIVLEFDVNAMCKLEPWHCQENRGVPLYDAYLPMIDVEPAGRFDDARPLNPLEACAYVAQALIAPLGSLNFEPDMDLRGWVVVRWAGLRPGSHACLFDWEQLPRTILQTETWLDNEVKKNDRIDLQNEMILSKEVYEGFGRM